jgi:hypothetical protein
MAYPFKSIAFQGDPALQGCATTDAQHIRLPEQSAGEAPSASKIKAALTVAGFAPAAGETWLRAVERFKRNRGLFTSSNPSTQFVGKGTISALDDIMFTHEKSGGRTTPPLPAPVPVVTDSDRYIGRVRGLLPRALTRQQSAVAMLDWGKIAIDFPDTNAFNVAALGLINRCFKISATSVSKDDAQKSAWKADIQRVRNVYTSGVTFLLDRSAGSYCISLSAAETRTALGKDANAFCHAGTWAKRDTAEGIWFSYEAGLKKADSWIIDLITHEVAHFCGPSPPSHVADLGYGNAALLLPRDKALKNASNHAWFAGLSQTPMSNWASGTYPS